MKAKCSLTRATLAVLVVGIFISAAAQEGRLRPTLFKAYPTREQTILHAAAAAVSAANSNGGEKTHANMVAAGFNHQTGNFIPGQDVGDKKISFRLVWNAETAIIGFQGSTKGEHQRLFLEGLLVVRHIQYGGNDVVVPAGLHDAYSSARQTIWSALGRAGGLVRDRMAGRRLVITGHSMGGLLANFLAADLLRIGHKVDAVVTFGAPQVATPTFKIYLEAMAAKQGTQLISVQNIHDTKITRWADIVGLRTTPGFYLNRIGTPVDYAFRHGEHDMKLYYAVAKARGLSTADNKVFPRVDGTYATVWPVANQNPGSVVRIKYWPQPGSGNWWKGLKVVDKRGRAYLIDVENGRFLSGRHGLVIARSLFEDQIRVEFWKAKALGVHTHVGSQDLIITPGGENAINIWW